MYRGQACRARRGVGSGSDHYHQPSICPDCILSLCLRAKGLLLFTSICTYQDMPEYSFCTKILLFENRNSKL